MCKKIIITDKDVKAAMNVAKSQEVKDVLAALFKPENKPNLDDYKSIKTYEDAVMALDEETPDFEALKAAGLPAHQIALMKLETISRALWGKNWEPKPDAEGSKYFWWPWFALWTKQEIEDRKEEFNGALLSAGAYFGANAGFGYLSARDRSSYAGANTGFRLCQETEEKAIYFGQQFIKLWAEYLAFNFTVGDFYFNE